MTFPAEGTDRQVRVDTFDRRGVERAVGLRRYLSEGDGLGRQRLLDPVSFRLRAFARRVSLRAQLGAHLARQARDRPQAEDEGRIALVRACRARAVAAHERVLRLRAGAVGPTLRVAAEASEGVGTARRPQMDATQRGRVAIALRSASTAPTVSGRNDTNSSPPTTKSVSIPSTSGQGVSGGVAC